ncbi:MAG: acyltransferase domain-containing protein [Desulfovibrio sp.]|jgi:malonyl CoA-acyl carrier protein transacylase|nr:acyltransferase domain-containing protein [Desulfovibrio sp.]
MPAAEDIDNPARHGPEELALDGVRYADLPQAGQVWRLGSTNPRWREELPLVPSRPVPEDIRLLASRGLWLGRGASPPLAVVCCGLGSVWPHMGRELYDNFPAARAGMDLVAAAADWDVLALMDEPDVEKISHTRWQQPYLFLLEYGQWSQLAALGLEPALLCGHSLGELIALCLAGVYAPEVAWYILDTRAMHMAEMEAGSTRENGMMAVHADAGVIARICGIWPDLLVSNYNTPRQFIMSGPREALTEARKWLRKQRIPALLLNVGLAYHHPGMRILRDLSLRRLNALPMRAPRLRALSSVTAGLYPEDQPSICRHIAELDENPVRWTDCVRFVYEGQGIRHFLELGPQDTLCSLIADNEAQALCLPVGRRGHETEQVRQVCARLYALGCLPRPAVRAALQERIRSGIPETAREAALAVAHPQQTFTADPRFSACMRILAEILAKAAGFPRDDIRPETDLRYDLSLRSSRFPLLLQEIEEGTGVRLLFENLLGVTCVGDLARAFCAAGPDTERQERPPVTPTQARKHEIAEITRGRRFVELPEISTLVFLPAVPAPSSTVIEGDCHFSRFADPSLASHIVRQRAEIPCLPVSRAMQALVEGACLLFPQLAGHGLSDIRFFDMPLLPPGVTRECPLAAKAQAKFIYDGLMTQMCRATLLVRAITANGRRADTRAEVMSGTVHMTAAPYAARLLWPASPDGEGVGEGAAVGNFYDAVGLAAPWRLLAAHRELPEGVYLARTATGQGCREENIVRGEGIAQKEKSRYTEILRIVEGIVQAALMAVAGKAGATGDSAEILAVLRPWRLNAAGFVIFNTLAPVPGTRRIQMRKSWDDGITMRFDAQAADARGRALVTLHHLEFFRQKETAL